MSLSPFILVLILGSLLLTAWSAAGVIQSARARRPISFSSVIVLTCTSAFFCLVWCLFLIVGASLGHSAHPLRDTWPQCVAGICVFVFLPTSLILWAWRRGLATGEKPENKAA